MTDEYIEMSCDIFNKEPIEDRFNEYIEAVERAEAEGTEVKVKFEVTDIATAEWALKKIAYHERTIEKCKQHMDQEVDRVKAWFEREKAGNEHYVNILKSLLLPYAEKELEDSPKKSLSLSQGTMSFRKGTPQYIYKDEDLMKYVKDNNLKEYVKEEVKWGEFKKNLKLTPNNHVITKDGELLDFITASVPGDSFYVKVAK